MSRDYAAIMKSADSVQTSITKDEVISLPPGYVVGFDVRLRQDYTVLVKAGAANVGGSLVQHSADHQLEDADWVAPKINSTRHYYIYLAKDGAFKVDIVAPVWNNDLLYYEQPDMNWRAIGKIFLVNSQIVYAAKQVELEGSTVTVAPNGYTGEADYYCTGDNDQILINAAVSYLHALYNGGQIRLMDGIYLIQTSPDSGGIIIPYSNILLTGSGAGSILRGIAASTFNYASVIFAYDIARINECRIDSVCVDMQYMLSDNACGIRLERADCCLVTHCLITNAKNNPIRVLDSYYGQISNNHVVGDITYQGRSCSAISCGGYFNHIVHNQIDNIAVDSSSYVCGIYISSNNSLMQSNTIQYLSSQSTSNMAFGIRCYGDRCLIEDNSICYLSNTGTASNVNGIKLESTAANCNVTSNYCYNNGSDTDIANTNSNNFYDGGTDTQVYSNSWQSPVSGESEQGELHWLPQATDTITGYTAGLTTTAAWSSVTMAAFLPVGAQTVKLNVMVAASSSAAGAAVHVVAFSNNTTSTPTLGTHQPQAGLYMQAGAGGELFRVMSQLEVPLDSNRKFYHYAVSRSNASACQIFFNPIGYKS